MECPLITFTVPLNEFPVFTLKSFTNFKIVFFKAFPVSMLNFDLKRKICAKNEQKTSKKRTRLKENDRLFSIVRLGLKYCKEENFNRIQFLSVGSVFKI